MRKFTLLTAVMSVAIIASGQNPEENNIKNLLRSETEAYFRRDLEAWKPLWVHDAQVNRNFISKNGSFTNNGWDSIAALRERVFKENPKPVPIQLKNDNYTIRTNGNMAWAEYDQEISYPDLDTTGGIGHSREYRVLVKENDQWKIASQITTYPKSFTANTPFAIENDLNNAGYQLIAINKIKEAIEVFALNVKLFPGAWNTYDSLGEAYALAGNKKLAIENYEKSIKLNPKSESGPAALAKLKQK